MDTAQALKEETTVNETDPQASANRLVLPSLEIKNFRAFRHLTIEKLGRVNLITGKNNVGKTSLLEALSIFAARSVPQVTQKLLLNRNERIPFFAKNGAGDELIAQFSSLFYSRLSNLDTGKAIFIGDLRRTKGIQLYLDWFKAEDLEYLKENYKEVRSVDAAFPNAVPCLVFGDSLTGWHGGRRSSLFEITTGKSQEVSNDAIPYQFVNSCGLTNNEQSVLWDKVHLTDAEEEVENSLRILSPNLVRLAFVANNSPEDRIPTVRMADSGVPAPLRSLGEGVSRMLGYVLSAANAANGILLIDEIENGLHYSVLPDVWRLIFQTARRLNVQVFATTHSWDCIEAFQQAASEDDDPASGVLVRLRNKDGDIVSTVFDKDDLAVITRDGIEVR